MIRLVYWIIWAVLGLVLETFALVNGVPNDTLTGVITTHLPGWLTWLGVSWLGWHFIVSYMNDKPER